jgi:hypothetical protein
MKTYRQGDVLLVRTRRLPKEAQAVEPGPRGIVLAEGEATGHAHVLAPDHVREWSVAEQRYITVDRPAPLTHEEHGTVVVEPGTYEVIRQVEYEPEGNRVVAD